MIHTDGFPIVAISSRADWRTWLMANHNTSTGVWLQFHKVSTGKPTISYEEGVFEALCFGWIDSKGNKFDKERSLLYYSPRNAFWKPPRWPRKTSALISSAVVANTEKKRAENQRGYDSSFLLIQCAHKAYRCTYGFGVYRSPVNGNGGLKLGFTR